mmetsp:Transcript_32307/g.67965  ORF Transcript_32307/g.67965 Transcript_32307/m.67965 type:complete len:572 (+) Transcript_32307:149-1864(+)
MPCSSEPSYFNAVTDLHSQAPSPCQDLLATCSLPETIDAEPTFSTSEQVIGEDVVSDGEEAYNCFHSSSTMLSAPWLSPSAMSTLPELTTPSADELPLPLRIVFLDIDGVLCCNQRCFLEPDKMSNLKHIVQTTGACVVLTSNWRLFEQLVQELLRVFAEYKIQCIGATPMCGMITELVRPLEIRAWLRGFEAQLADDPAEKSAQVSASMQYVAIDDRQLLDEQGGDDLHGKFLLTDPTLGLTESGAAQAIEILTSTELHAMNDETRDFLAADDALHIEFFAAEPSDALGSLWAPACSKCAPEQRWSVGDVPLDRDSGVTDERVDGSSGEVGACDERAPDESAPNDSAPDESAPNDSAPDGSAPNDSAPDGCALQQALGDFAARGGASNGEEKDGDGSEDAGSQEDGIGNTGSSESGSGHLGCAVFVNAKMRETDSDGAADVGVSGKSAGLVAVCSERDASESGREAGVSPLRKRLRAEGGAPTLGVELQCSGAGVEADDADERRDGSALDWFDETGQGKGSASKSGYYCRFGADSLASTGFCTSARALWERKRPLHSLSSEAATNGQDGN